MNAFTLAADPTKPFVAPDSAAPVPYINLAPLHNAVAGLEKAAAAYDRAVTAALAAGAPVPNTAELNQLLARTERLLTREEGLPRRPWFRHLIYAPGFYTGYGVKTLPGVREGLEEESYAEAEAYVGHTAAALNRVSAALERATELLQGG